MKRHLLAGAALMALTALPACDAVRLPGINPSGQETAAAAPATGMTQSDSQVLAAEPETDAADMGETPTVDRDAVAPQAPDDMRVAPESLIDETAAPAPEASDPDAAEIESSGLTLAELNTAHHAGAQGIAAIRGLWPSNQ